MLPLTFASTDEELIIKKVGGSPETKRHLEDLGFAPGVKITVINSMNGSFIVNVRECRVAISRELAQKIMV